MSIRYILVLSIFFFTSCIHDKLEQIENNSLDKGFSIHCNQILHLENNQLLAVLESNYINSDSLGYTEVTIRRLDDNLEIQKTYRKNENRSIFNPFLTPIHDGFFLQYYTHDRKNPLEKSVIIYMDTLFRFNRCPRYEHHSRITNSVSISDNSLYSTYYQREELNTSLKLIKNGKIKWSRTFTYSNETSQPTAITKLNDGEIVIAGIDGGFNYNDGHNYDTEHTSVYIFSTDLDGALTHENRFSSKGHLFVNDLGMTDQNIIIPTYGHIDSSGMDVKLYILDHDLNLVTEVPIKSQGIQRVNKIEIIDDGIYLIGSSLSDNSDRSAAWILKLGSDYTIDWQKTLTEKELNLTADDFSVHDNTLYVAVNKSNSLTHIKSSSIYKFDNDGILLKERKLN